MTTIITTTSAATSDDAVRQAHAAVRELEEREAADRAARVDRLMRWTGGDRMAAQAQEAAAIQTEDRSDLGEIIVDGT
jgi:hypothetical protein